MAIARAIALDPPLVLADEPTAHLDYIQVEAVLTLLREIADSGRIVVVSTHDDRMVPLADKVVSMSPRPHADDGGPTRLAGRTRGPVPAGGPRRSRLIVDSVRWSSFARAPTVTKRCWSDRSGNYSGELAPLFGIRRSATARATKPARLTGMTVTEFRRRTRGQRLWPALDDLEPGS